jgi:hypothetical protein
VGPANLPPSNLLVLGLFPQTHPQGIGAQESLLYCKRLRGEKLKLTENGVALSYSWLDVTEDEGERCHLFSEEQPIARINVWSVEGDPNVRDLLDFSLSREKLLAEDLVILIVLDFEKPWDCKTYFLITQYLASSHVGSRFLRPISAPSTSATLSGPTYRSPSPDR